MADNPAWQAKVLATAFVLSALLSAALSAPAAAQEWHARATPLIPDSEQATPICHVSSGEDFPFVAFTFERDRTRFGVAADEFLERDDIRDYRGTLPSGASFTISLGSDPSSNVAVLTFGDRAGGLQLVEHFLSSGDFSLVGNGVHIEIPALPSASSEMEKLHNCLRELDDG